MSSGERRENGQETKVLLLSLKKRKLRGEGMPR